jgi:hypothetical protein
MQNFLSNMVAVIIMALVSFFCCPLVGIVLGILGLVQCQGDAKRNATILLIVGVVAAVLNGILFGTGVVKIPGR